MWAWILIQWTDFGRGMSALSIVSLLPLHLWVEHKELWSSSQVSYNLSGLLSHQNITMSVSRSNIASRGEITSHYVRERVRIWMWTILRINFAQPSLFVMKKVNTILSLHLPEAKANTPFTCLMEFLTVSSTHTQIHTLPCCKQTCGQSAAVPLLKGEVVSVLLLW